VAWPAFGRRGGDKRRPYIRGDIARHFHGGRRARRAAHHDDWKSRADRAAVV